jgi:hypothetical protein
VIQYDKAALLPGTPFYDDYLPSYYSGSLLWSGATPLLPLSNASWWGGCNIPHFYIDLIPGQNPVGPGFIGGLVREGANLQGHGKNSIHPTSARIPACIH